MRTRADRWRHSQRLFKCLVMFLGWCVSNAGGCVAAMSASVRESGNSR